MMRGYRSSLVSSTLVVLRPRPDEVVRRELARQAGAYASWVGAGGSLVDAVEQFDRWLDETPRVGLWIDSTQQRVDETVSEILSRWDEAVIEDVALPVPQ